MKRIAIATASFLTTIAAYAAYVGVMADSSTGTVALPSLEARIAKWAAITDHPTTLAGYGILDAPTWQQMIDYVVDNTTPIGFTNEPAFVGWTNQWHSPIVAHLAITNGNPHGITAEMLGSVGTNDNTYTSTVEKAATAYSWGNHSAAGYLTGFTETDSIFTASAAYGITTNLIAYWNTAFSWGDHSTQGYLKVESEPLWNAWVTNSESGSTNAVLPDGSLVDIGPLLGQVPIGSPSVTGLTINVGTDNNLTPDHAYVFGTRCGATGENAVAMGYRASAIHSNTFVWADHSRESAFNDFGPNTFNVRAAGGMYLMSTNIWMSKYDALHGWTHTRLLTTNELGTSVSNLVANNTNVVHARHTGDVAIVGRLSLGSSSQFPTGTGSVCIAGGTCENAASGYNSVTIGGCDNLASGESSIAIGGGDSEATGVWSMSLNGEDCIAGGRRSIASGCAAMATNDEAFVWSDWQTDTSGCISYGSHGSNTFNIRAQNGFWTEGDHYIVGNNGFSGSIKIWDHADASFIPLFVNDDDQVEIGGNVAALKVPALDLNGDSRSSWPTSLTDSQAGQIASNVVAQRQPTGVVNVATAKVVAGVVQIDPRTAATWRVPANTAVTGWNIFTNVASTQSVYVLVWINPVTNTWTWPAGAVGTTNAPATDNVYRLRALALPSGASGSTNWNVY